MRRRLWTLSLLAIGAVPFARARAQCADTASTWYSVVTVGSTSDDRRRIAQDLGRCGTRGALIRSAASLTEPFDYVSRVRWATAAPVVDVTYNSKLPFSLNDGAEWAGRGVSARVSAGIRFEAGPVSASLAPELTYSQNSLFQVLPSNAPDRSAFASPWHSGIESADLPLRFGTESFAELDPGQSWIEARGGPLAVGVSSDDQWWGPGVRNALVMSNNAPGVPQAYLRTVRPISTPIGDVELRWMVGALTESRFFDTVSTNDIRSLSGLVATLRVPFDTGLTVGVARTVYAPAAHGLDVVSHAFDVITRWNQVADTLAPAPSHPSDQLLSLFGRWVFPESGFEVYAEWAKLFAPGLREMLVAPQLHQGYTLGLQWVNPLAAGRAVRLQSEATMLEQTPPTARATTPSFYTSRFVPQGYTQQGQSIGAAIGPGSSSQWIAGDYLARDWRGGVELGRIRWEDEAYYRSPNGLGFSSHDVSIFAGLRGGLSKMGVDTDVELIVAKRLNYLFQSSVSGFQEDRAFDIDNITLRLRVAPR